VAVYEALNCGFADLFPVDLNSLTKTDQMRRRKQSRSITCLMQHRRRHGGAGALAVGPGNVDGLVCILGAIESVKELGDVLKAEFHPEEFPGQDKLLGGLVGMAAHQSLVM
jgi:hypothetical protein